jgi:biotin-(acetyl-CoA carboxylase) ligase
MAPTDGFHTRAYDECDSTQDEARALLDAGHPLVLVHTGHQRAGRGREGRSWQDEPGTALLMSVGVARPPAAGDAASWMSAAAAGICALLVERYGVTAAPRLPNDLMVGDGKVGGILADARSSGSGPIEQVVFGIGINLAGSRRLIDGRKATTLAAEGVAAFADPWAPGFATAREELMGAVAQLVRGLTGS